MPTKQPIKRIDVLKPLSRDHHHSLLLVWKIRKGLKANVDISRIEKYVKWFYTTYELPHFKKEDDFILPLLKDESEALIKVENEHKLLKQYFEQDTYTKNSLNNLADLLEAHIRYEERELFNIVQKTASTKQLEELEILESSLKFKENETDQFWL